MKAYITLMSTENGGRKDPIVNHSRFIAKYNGNLFSIKFELDVPLEPGSSCLGGISFLCPDLLGNVKLGDTIELFDGTKFGTAIVEEL